MKTIVIKAQTDSQVELLIAYVKKLHLDYEVVENEESEKRAILKIAEKSFGKDWSLK